jgi:hypothetical protein
LYKKVDNGSQQPTGIAEVAFFFLLQVGPKRRGVALVSLFGPPSVDLLRKSNNTYYTAQHLRDTSIKVIDAKSIRSVVMMAPDPQYKLYHRDGTETDWWFAMDRIGLKLLTYLDVTEEEPEAEQEG